MNEKRHDDRPLEVDDDPELTRRASRAQVVGRWVLVLVVAATSVGVVGHGPVSWASARTGDGRIEVAYERFGRRGGSQTVTLSATSEAAADGQWTIRLSGALASDHELSTITPEPDAMRAAPDGIELTFGQRGDADLSVVLALSPGGMWTETSGVGIAGEEQLVVRQFIYP
jgi:hypothetical protein